MLFPALGMTTAMWLLAAPLTGLEIGGRADLVVAVGAVAFVASLLGMWSRPARISLTLLGILLGLANFVMAGSVGALASLATCAFGLVAAGTAPWPVATVHAAVTALPVRPRPAGADERPTVPQGLPVAA